MKKIYIFLSIINIPIIYAADSVNQKKSLYSSTPEFPTIETLPTKQLSSSSPPIILTEEERDALKKVIPDNDSTLCPEAHSPYRPLEPSLDHNFLTPEEIKRLKHLDYTYPYARNPAIDRKSYWMKREILRLCKENLK